MMKRLLCTAAVTLIASASWAQNMADSWRNGTNTFRFLGSASQGSTNLGLDYERRMGAAGLGVYVIHADENDDANVLSAEKTFLGLQAPIHLIDQSPWDLYIAPGVAAIMYEDAPTGGTGEDETTVNASLRIGSAWYFNNTWALGLDWLHTTNWFSKDVAAHEEMTNITVSYTY